MNRRIIILIAGLLSLTGCTTTPQHSIGELTQHKSIPTIALHPLCDLSVDKIWPLKGQGTYLQNVKTVAGDQEHTLTVHITIKSDQLDFVAFNDAVGRLYQLTWTPKSLTWQTSEHIPPTLLPENILGDFLLVHLTAEELQKTLVGAWVVEDKDVRLIQNDQGILRKIIRSQPMGSLWQNVTIHNPLIGYSLEIQTIPAS